MASGVPVSEAVMQFFVEAMRANTNVLERVGEGLRGVQDEQREQLKMVNDVRERVIRIEALPRVEKELRDLAAKVSQLEMSKAQEDARASTWAAIVKFGPSMAGIVVTIIASVFIILVASGQLAVREAASPSEQHEPRPTDPR